MYIHICTYLLIHMYVNVSVGMWRSENNPKESAFSFCLVGSRDGIQVIHPDNKHLYPLSHFTGPCSYYSCLEIRPFILVHTGR